MKNDLWLHSDNVVSDDQELEDTFSKFFERAVDDLAIQEYESDYNIDINSMSGNLIDYSIEKYKNHPSKWQMKNVSFESRFSFTDLNKDNIQRKILNLNSRQHTFWNIPTKISKSSSGICNVVLQNVWNAEISGKLYFPNKLKLRDTTPVYKKRSYSSWKL